MRQSIKQCVMATLALIIPSVSQAKDHDDDGKVCRDSTLHGLYVFNASGFNIVGGIAQPKAIVELIRFNGDGSLTVPAATVSINGTVTRSPPNGTGRYTVGPDCTGSLVFGPPLAPPGPAYDLVVEFGGSELHMIQTGPGSPVFQGTAERLSR